MSFNAYKINEIINITDFYTIFEAYRKGGYSFSGESHDFWECVYVTEGNVCVSAEERIYMLKKGDIIFHKPLELHKYHVEKKDNARLFIFSFSGKMLEFFENKVFSLNENQIEIIKKFISFIHEKSVPHIHNISEDFNVLQILRKSDTHMFMARTYLYELFVSICDSFNVISETNSESAKIFKSAVNFMNENIHLPLKIKDIAEKCCISATGLKKIFSEYAGMGVHKYFLMLKIAKASAMLSSGVSVSNTAEKLGFPSQAYFSCAYKRETGMLPSEIK